MTRKTSLVLKLLFGVVCFGFIFYRLSDQFTKEKTAELVRTFDSSRNLYLLLLTTLLLLLNWGIESFKWQLITRQIEEISFGKALKSILTGLCVGNLTPGRIGEFAGRILFFKPENRSRITVTHFVCGLTQLFVTVTVGILALGFVLSHETENSKNLYVILALCSVLLILLSLMVIHINKVYARLSSWRILKRFDLGQVTYPKKTMLNLLFLSLLRYSVFSFQYFLLLKIFGIRAGNFEAFCAIAVSFMLMSSIPMISFIEIAVRAAIAVMLFGEFQQNSLQLVSASTLLWVINIAIPSIAGYFFAVQENFVFRLTKTPER
ncbi:MAG: lysylphosphatidylglycerol synthase domain-containing protein [Bacteroidia bacterium]